MFSVFVVFGDKWHKTFSQTKEVFHDGHQATGKVVKAQLVNHILCHVFIKIGKADELVKVDQMKQGCLMARKLVVEIQYEQRERAFVAASVGKRILDLVA